MSDDTIQTASARRPTRRIVIAVAHFYDPDGKSATTLAGRHGSTRPDPRPRLEALRACILGLHQPVSKSQVMIKTSDRDTEPANDWLHGQVSVLVCTWKDRHLLNYLNLPQWMYRQVQCEIDDPRYLGFAAQRMLGRLAGRYDTYGFIEDDLIIADPWYFAKLDWFNASFGPEALLQPNRYELRENERPVKAYVDGEIRAARTAPFQNVEEAPDLHLPYMDGNLHFRRVTNPHSGCYFLSDAQLRRWQQRPDFGEDSDKFIGPLESAATLGVMRGFRVYKPGPANAAFLEIQHHGTGFIDLIGSVVKAPPLKASV